MSNENLWRFRRWWQEPEQEELRKSCAEGWGWIIWQAALSSKQEEA